AANPLPAASSVPEAAPSKPREVEVTVPVDSVGRMHFQFAKVSGGTMSTDIRVPGTVQANAYGEVHVTPIAGGVVTQVSVELGQRVKRGQPIAQVLSQELAAAQTEFVSF